MANKKWVLIIDDDADFRAALAEGLVHLNYPSVLATSAREALQKLRKQSFFCVITDMKLGDESGEEVIRYVRDSGHNEVDSRTPILVVSGYLDRDVAARVGKLINGAIVKPCTVQQVIDKLKQLESAAPKSA